MKSTPRILYEDNHLLVVDKPAQLATMGVSGDAESLVGILKQYLRKKYDKPGNVYLGVVSRLDSLVTGVIVIARTSKAADRLNRQFHSRSCSKTYLAIIPQVEKFPESGRLEHYLRKNEAIQRMVVVKGNESQPGAQVASLRFQTLGQSDGKRLVQIELETGRKHQIRVQFSAMGCPIVGDRKYGSIIKFPVGIALHSRRLQIQHPTTKAPLLFEAPPPQYWNVQRFGIPGGDCEGKVTPFG
jgi:23S rRNA pseudouridine1911/1915/1917 synthase